MQRIGGERLAFGIARGALQRPGAPEIHRDIDQQDDEGDGRDRWWWRAFAQTAVGFDQNAARQHIEQRDNAERGYALQLAVAVMMLLVRGAVGHLYHEPSDDGRNHVDRRVQRLGHQGEAADRYANHEFGRGHAGAGKNRNRRDAGFDGVIGRAHGRGFSSPSTNIKAPIKCVIATRLLQRLLRIVPTKNCPCAILALIPLGWISAIRRPS